MSDIEREEVAADSYTYTCEGCGHELDDAACLEYPHICEHWFDTHGIFDEVPMIRVEARSSGPGGP